MIAVAMSRETSMPESYGAGRGLVQANGSSNEGRESLLIDFIVLVEVDCAPGVAFEA